MEIAFRKGIWSRPRVPARTRDLRGRQHRCQARLERVTRKRADSAGNTRSNTVSSVSSECSSKRLLPEPVCWYSRLAPWISIIGMTESYAMAALGLPWLYDTVLLLLL